MHESEERKHREGEVKKNYCEQLFKTHIFRFARYKKKQLKKKIDFNEQIETEKKKLSGAFLMY